MKQMRISTILAAFVTGAVITSATAAPELVHRWSFNGDYTDSIGGTSATTIGSAVALNEGNTAVVMSGDGNSTGSLDLGTDMLPTDVREVTVEIWAAQTAVKNWARLIDYGPNNQNYFICVWNNGTDAGRGLVKVAKGNASYMDQDGGVSPITLNTQYHFSFVFKMNADGSTTIRWARRNATTGAVERNGVAEVLNWNLMDLASPKLYIGHSQYTSDADANAIYDEVRVWRGGLTDEQLTASAASGPDALPDVGTSTTIGTARWTGAVDDDATNAANWTPSAPDANTFAVFSGDFAAQIPSGAAFTCAGVVFEDARLTADCDWRGLVAKIKSGTLDLAGHALKVSQIDGIGTITEGGVPAEYQPIEYIESSERNGSTQASRPRAMTASS